MNLELKSVEFVVFDEADRLFELGFATQLHEILYRLPTNRQTLLFSATLPKSLVEFAKAGLQNPKLVRLDAESKISADLRMAFFSVKPVEKEAALLCVLRDVIGVPLASENPRPQNDWSERTDPRKKRRRTTEAGNGMDEMPPHQTLVFAATKHHVEYLSGLMTAAGYAVSAIYGSLDHTARKMQLSAFRDGRTQILCVTDLAARGIDIPILENVLNYDFPVGARTFIHRVGRTARAGRKGWAYSLLTAADLPHLLDLQLFLSRPLVNWTSEEAAKHIAGDEPNYSDALVLGNLPRDALDQENEHCRTVLIDPSPTLLALQGVAQRGQKMYDRSSAKASAESYRRAKDLVAAMDRALLVHPVATAAVSRPEHAASASDLLARVKAFRPAETVFELGSRGKTAGAKLMKERRATLGKIAASKAVRKQVEADGHADDEPVEVPEVGDGDAGDMGGVDDAELEVDRTT
jgi:ATP-dependent RNA helicase DDX54/DBP10